MAAVLVMLAGGCQWTSVRFGPEGSGFNPYESTIGSSNVNTLVQRWSTPAFGYGVTPVVAGGLVYTSTPDGSNWDLTASDAGTGAVKWRDTSGEPSGQLTVASGLVLSTDFETELVSAYDASTGVLKWTSTVAAVQPAIVSTDGIAFIAGNDAKLHALDVTTGAERWSVATDATPGLPAVANGVVVVPTRQTNGLAISGSLRAYDTATGALKWSIAYAGPPATPAIVNGTVYDAADLAVFGLDLTTGAIKWMTGPVQCSGPAAVAYGLMYVDCNGVTAFDATTGSKAWGPSTFNGSDPAVANGVVYVSSLDRQDGSIAALDAHTGATLFTKAPPTGEGIYGATAIVDGLLYVITQPTDIFHLQTAHLHVLGLPT
jgi:outer membrane protein assembly factor BamB